MAEYLTIADYICDGTVAKTRLAKIQECIDALMDAQLKAISNSDVQELTFNDGQTVIKTAFRSPEAMARMMHELEKQKAYIFNNCMGRVQTMRQFNTFRNRG